MELQCHLQVARVNFVQNLPLNLCSPHFLEKLIPVRNITIHWKVEHFITQLLLLMNVNVTFTICPSCEAVYGCHVPGRMAMF